jgi:hypothetical protein
VKKMFNILEMFLPRKVANDSLPEATLYLRNPSDYLFKRSQQIVQSIPDELSPSEAFIKMQELCDKDLIPITFEETVYLVARN